MTDDTSPVIELRGLTYTLEGTCLLDAVDLSVHRGEIVGVMGRSGSGKTTLLRLLIGFIPPTAGHIIVQGTDVTALTEAGLDRVRLSMGMVFQGAALFDSMTVGENVAFPLREHRRAQPGELPSRVEHLLELVGLRGTERRLPAQLSGGMRKRVGLARALALEPAIMLYDEPTAGLDPISAAAIDALIVQLREQTGVTSVIVSHDIHSLRRVADRVAVLFRGRFLAVGPLAELEQSAEAAVQQFLRGTLDGPMTGEVESPERS